MEDRLRCFLIERVNENTVLEPCDDEDCPDDAHEHTTFDARRADTGEIVAAGIDYLSSNMPPGAMWFADIHSSEADYRPSGPRDWGDRNDEQLRTLRALAEERPDYYTDVDPDTGLPARKPTGFFFSGPHLKLMTPGGLWVIDSRASNCGLPWDYEHRCWVRRGEPPDVSVTKDGPTCAAGAGSIQAGDYHGFLVAGYLQPNQ